MIYVTDNGLDYSDHTIYFIELPDDLPQKDAIYLCENDPLYETRDRKVVAVAKNFEWRDGKDVAQVCNWYGLRGVLGTRISKRLSMWLKHCRQDILLPIIEEGIEQNNRWGECVAPICAPEQIKDGLPVWKEHDSDLEKLRAWVMNGMPLPAVDPTLDEDESWD